MKTLTDMFSFSSKLWYDKRWILRSGEVSLYLQVVLNGKHKEIPLKLKWLPQFIDLEHNTLLPRFKRDPDVNDYLLQINLEIGKHHDIFKAYRIRNENLDIKTFTRELTVFNDKECFLKYMEVEAKRRYTRKEIDKKTYQNANATRKAIVEYDPDALFKNINLKWLKGFRSHLVSKGYKNSSIWSRLAFTKAYLKLASLEPLLYVNQEVLTFSNPKPTYQTTFLNNDEVRRLMILSRNGSLTDIQSRVLSGFLFTCFTSLRISDLYRVNSKWQLDETTLKFIPKKNEKRQKWLTIPIMPLANHFVKDITGKYFDLPTEQTYNRILKDIAIEADINKKLSSHVGRHTFGYLYMTTNGNIRGLQEILGHSKIETTERYAHLDDDYQRSAVKKMQDNFSDLLLRKIQ